MGEFIISAILGDDPETDREILALFSSGTIPTKDHANMGHTDAESIDWFAATREEVKGLAEAYPGVLVASSNKYDTK